MRYLTIFVILAFHLSWTIAQVQKQVNPQKVDEWKYKIYSAKDGSIKDSINAIGVVVFYSNYMIVEPIIDTNANSRLLNRKSIRHAQIIFHVYKLQDLSYAQQTAQNIKAKSFCKLNQGVGDYFISGEYVFVNMEDCFPCIILNGSVDMCKPFIEKQFKKVDPQKGIQLKDLLKQLSIKEEE